MSVFHNLLRMEVALPSTRSLERFFAWFLAGLSVFLPRQIRHRTWGPYSTLIELTPELGVEEQSSVERSLFGERRLSNDSSALTVPKSLALASSDYFTTSISLPAEAEGSLKDAVELRLNEISPLPIENTVFALGRPEKTATNRLKVPVVITRQTTLAAVTTYYSSEELLEIGASPDHQGVLQFVFEQPNAEKRSAKRSLFTLGLLVASFAFLSFGIDVHLSKRLASIEAYEAALLSELRATRKDNALFNDIDQSVLERSKTQSFEEIASEVKAQMADLPNGAIIKHISVENGLVSIEGISPTLDDINASSLAHQQHSDNLDNGYQVFHLHSEKDGAS